MNSTLELRKYQELILTQAKVSNTIAYLPTGTGKTLIACHLIKDRLESLRKKREEAKNVSNDLPIIVFIAPTKALLNQQIEYIKSHANPVLAHEFTGDSLYEGKSDRQIDKWERSEWLQQITKYEVLGMTPKICADCLAKRLFPTKIIDLIILDECHHAVKNHPMSELCESLRVSEGTKPLIFGMTASPIDSKTKDLIGAIFNLESKLLGQFYYPSPEFLHLLQSFWKTPRMFLINPASLPSAFTPPINPVQSFEQIKLLLEMSGKLEDVYFQDKQLFFGKSRSTENSSSFFNQIVNSLKSTPGGVDPANTFKFEQLGEFKQVKEIIHQVIEITKSCGVYCGIYALLYRLETTDEVLAKQRYYRDQMYQNNMISLLQEMVDEVPGLSSFRGNSSSANPLIKGDDIDLLAKLLDSKVHESYSSKRVVCLDLLEKKTEELIEVIDGEEKTFRHLLNQPKVALHGYHSLIILFAQSLFGADYRNQLKKLLEKHVSNSNEELAELLRCYYQLFEELDPVQRQEIYRQLTNKDYHLIFTQLCQDLLTCISIQPLVDRFLVYHNIKKDDVLQAISSTQIDRASTSSAFPLFSQKVECLADLLASSSSFFQAKDGSKPIDSRGYGLIEVSLSQTKNATAVMKKTLQTRELSSIMQGDLSNPSSPLQAKSNRGREGDTATIVFCEMKLTAISLSHLMQQIMADIGDQLAASPDSMPIRAGVLLGSNSILQQKKTLQALKQNQINLLFATNVAQEGLDVKQCNLIVNYDPPGTLIGFIQRRGRARSSQSLYIQLVDSLDEKNKENGRATKDAMEFIKQEEETNKILQKFLEFIQNGEIFQNDMNSLQNVGFTVPSTGARVNGIQARSLLQEYCTYVMSKDPTAIQKNTDYMLIDHVRYIFDRKKDDISGVPTGEYRCLLFLPDYFHQFKFVNDCPSFFLADDKKKRVAEGNAALQAIEYLYKKHELNDYLQIIPLPIITNNMTASETSDSGLEEMEQKQQNESKNMIQVNIQTLPSAFTDHQALQESTNGKIQIYCYGLRFLHLKSFKSDQNDDLFSFKYVSQLKALQKIGIVTLSALPQLALADCYDLFLPPTFSSNAPQMQKVAVEQQDEDNSRLAFQLVYLGTRESSSEEYSHITELNTIINEIPSLEFKSLHGSSTDRPFHSKATTQELLAHLLLIHGGRFTPVQNYNVLTVPLPDSVVTKINEDSSDGSLSEFINLFWNLDYLKDCLIEAMVLIANLTIVQKNNYHQSPGDTFPFLSKGDFIKALEVEGMHSNVIDTSQVYSTNGKNLFCFEHHKLFNQFKLSDSMDEKKKDSKTFAQHLVKQNPGIADALTAFMTRNPDYLLQRAYTLTGVLSHIDLLRGGVAAAPPVAGPSSSTSHNEIDVFPPLCCPIGSLFYYHLILLLPSLLHRIHSILMAEEMFTQALSLDKAISKINLSVHSPLRLADFLAAITPRRNLHSFNSERLEFLGDVFLKYAATLYSFFLETQVNESSLTNHRGTFLSNKSLTAVANDCNISRFLRVMQVNHHLPAEILVSFDVEKAENEDHGQINKRARFNPPEKKDEEIQWNHSLRNQNISLSAAQINNKKKQLAQNAQKESKLSSTRDPEDKEEEIIIEEGKIENNSVTVQIREKVIADMMEAILGACVVDEEHERIGFYLLHHLKILPEEALSLHDLLQFMNDFIVGLENRASEFIISNLTATQLTERIDYTFHHSSLLALCTKPLSSFATLHYQRLEFLGDAVLDYLVTRFLYQLSSNWQEGHLSKLKSLMTENFTLTQINQRLGLSSFLQGTSIGLQMDILRSEGSSAIGEAGDSDKGSTEAGVSEKKASRKLNMNHILKVTHTCGKEKSGKALADQMEVLIGAMYLDHRGDLAVVKGWLESIGYFDLSAEDLEAVLTSKLIE